MSRKRRTFDITLPDEPTAAPRSSDLSQARRGPMATAVRETGDSLAARRDAEAEIRAENDRLAHEFVALKQQGLIVGRIPLDKVHASKLIRDRSASVDPELAELMDSIRSVGLSNPIQVEQMEDGSYELIQGFRRLSAFRKLAEEDDRFATIPAGITASGQGTETLYRLMVDENLVRKDISFAEMATLARGYGSDPRVGAPGTEEAIRVLYASAGKQKRSYIRAFASLLDMLDKVLAFPEEIPRALGLQLRQRISDVPGTVGAISKALMKMPNRSVRDELDVLRRFAGGEVLEPEGGFPAGNHDRPVPPKPKGKTTLRVEVPGGTARLTASDGRVELRLDRDFTEYEASRLETALQSFLRALD